MKYACILATIDALCNSLFDLIRLKVIDGEIGNLMAE